MNIFVMRLSMYFHMQSSIATRDFVTLQVQVCMCVYVCAYSHRYLTLIELTKYTVNVLYLS